MNVPKWKAVAKGDEFYWENPDDPVQSGTYKIIEILTQTGLIARCDDVVVIENRAGSVSEVYVSEIA